MKSTKYVALPILLGLMVLVGAGCQSPDSVSEEEPPAIDRDAILQQAKNTGLIMSDEEIQMMTQAVNADEGVQEITNVDVFFEEDQDYSQWNSAALADVTGGEAYGIARAKYENGQYKLVVTMGGLPEPAEGYFYEGWIVRRGENLSAISTGQALLEGEEYVNVYLSSTDLQEHDFYVLTLEPDDGNPAPAEHILEGRLK